MQPRHANLIAWQRADDLYIDIHRIARGFPPLERFELASQIRRAAYSVAANIVEGFARRSLRERTHFLNVAEASLAEVGYCIHVAHRLGYINAESRAELELRVRATMSPLVGLIRKV